MYSVYSGKGTKSKTYTLTEKTIRMKTERQRRATSDEGNRTINTEKANKKMTSGIDDGPND